MLMLNICCNCLLFLHHCQLFFWLFGQTQRYIQGYLVVTSRLRLLKYAKRSFFTNGFLSSNVMTKVEFVSVIWCLWWRSRACRDFVTSELNALPSLTFCQRLLLSAWVTKAEICFIWGKCVWGLVFVDLACMFKHVIVVHLLNFIS